MTQTGRQCLQKETRARDDSQSLATSDTNYLVITPSKISSENDFDFHAGKWTIHNKALKTRLKNSDDWFEFESTCETHKILNGFGNIN